MQRRLFLAQSTLLLAQTGPSLEMAQEMVGVCHRDLARVKQLLEKHPGLALATIDWGFGDWESGLDAASHVGRREIAELLLSRGARPTIFSAAMLGQLAVVKAFVEAQPGIQRTYGPHSLTLLAHARAGGPAAAGVVEYLKSLGDADTPLPTQPLSAEQRQSVLGRYRDGDQNFLVDVKNDRLGISGSGLPARPLLFHTGSLLFRPAGAPHASLRFDPQAGTLEIHNGTQRISATRL